MSLFGTCTKTTTYDVENPCPCLEHVQTCSEVKTVNDNWISNGNTYINKLWNVKIRRYLASCTLQFWSNLIKIIFQGKHFNYFIVLGGAMFFEAIHIISLRYTRNIVQLNSFYIKFDSKHFFIYIINTITNWWVSLSKICHSWPNNIVTHSCAVRILELLRYLVIRDIFLIMKLVN